MLHIYCEGFKAGFHYLTIAYDLGTNTFTILASVLLSWGLCKLTLDKRADV